MAQNTSLTTKQNFQVLDNVPVNQKMSGPEFTGFLDDFKKAGVNQGAFDETDIVIDGTGSFDNKTYNQATLTLTGGTSVATSGDNEGVVQITLDQDTILAFGGTFDLNKIVGLPETNKLPAGVHAWIIKHDPINSKLSFTVKTSVDALLINGFEVDGFSFEPSNIVIADGTTVDDTKGSVGGSSFKTTEAAATAAKAAFDLNPDALYLVYIKAFDGYYQPVSVDGAITYPDIHYFNEPKAIVRATGTGSAPFGDFTNGAGNYFFHGKGEWYTSLAVFIPNTFGFTEASTVFLSASVVQSFSILNDNTINPNPRAKCDLHIDTLISTGTFENSDSRDTGGGDIKWFNTDFLGGVVFNLAFQEKSKHYYERCKFRLSPAIHNPVDGVWDVVSKEGTALFSIDLSGIALNDQSLLEDFSSFANVQANVDSVISSFNRAACVTIRVLEGIKMKFVDCDFYIDQDKAIGFKLQVFDALDSETSTYKLIRPRFIDTSGGTTTSVVAYKTSAAFPDPKIIIENAESSADVFRTSHTDPVANPDIPIFGGVADKLDKEATTDQSIISKVEFRSQAHANNQSNAVKTFSATPTFDFDAEGNDQQMTLTGNVTTFSTSNEEGSANYKVWLINDGTAGRTVSAPVGWTKVASSDDHSDLANAENLYQFFTRPDGTKKYSILNI